MLLKLCFLDGSITIQKGHSNFKPFVVAAEYCLVKRSLSSRKQKHLAHANAKDCTVVHFGPPLCTQYHRSKMAMTMTDFIGSMGPGNF